MAEEISSTASIASSDFSQVSFDCATENLDIKLPSIPGTASNIVSCSINFKVDNQLFKGFLLVPHQIEATSKSRDKVQLVEKAYTTWIEQIKRVVAQGHQIVHDGPDAGPLTELEHWRNMLARLNTVVEFTDSKPFQNYMKCLMLSRSKLIEVRERKRGD